MNDLFVDTFSPDHVLSGTYVGSGLHATVHTIGDHAFKLFRCDDAYEEFIEFAVRHPSPAFPKVYNTFQCDGCLCVEMEILRCDNGAANSVAKMFFADCNIQANRPLRSVPAFRENLKLFPKHRDPMMMHVVKAYRALIRAGFFKDFCFDLYPDCSNIMFRGSQPVITDPVA